MLKKYQEFIPQLFDSLKEYSWAIFKKDLCAGITVGIIAIPLAMAFALASGVAPERGLYTAIVGGFLISFLGGSRVQIGGPTGAFVVVVYSVVQRHGYEGLVLATFIASFLLFFLGIIRAGTLIKYIPRPLVVGFTTGIALVVFSSQLKDFFGLKLEHLPAAFLVKWHAYFLAAASWDMPTTVFSFSMIGGIILIRRYLPSYPWAILSIVFGTSICAIFDLPIHTIASRFGEVPHFLPSPSVNLPWNRVWEVIPDAITIALLAGIESLLSAVIADGIIRAEHKSNCELIAQGAANLGSVLFGGMPATAAIARTATNIKSGACTPIAGMIHALTVFLAIFLFAPLVGRIPLASLATVMVMVTWHMSHLSVFKEMLRAPKDDVLILLTTFLLTVLINLTVAIGVGMGLAALLFMRRMSSLEEVIALRHEQTEKGIAIYDLKGPIFFGVVDRLTKLSQHSESPPRTCVLRMKHVPVLDITAIYALQQLHLNCKEKQIELVLTSVQTQPAGLMKQFGLGDLVEEDKFI